MLALFKATKTGNQWQKKVYEIENYRFTRYRRKIPLIKFCHKREVGIRLLNVIHAITWQWQRSNIFMLPCCLRNILLHQLWLWRHRRVIIPGFCSYSVSIMHKTKLLSTMVFGISAQEEKNPINQYPKSMHCN